MSKDLVFFVPYHTGYAHIELILSFASFAHVHLFVYKWNPAQKLLRDYFAASTRVYVHEFSLDALLTELTREAKQQRQVVVLLTASLNYSLGQCQLRFFQCLQKHVPAIIDVYSTGHCMYGCQSCTHEHSHRLPITFTNYMRTRGSASLDMDKSREVVICPSFSSADAPFSLLSNREIVQQIVAFSFPHQIKLHPLTYPLKDGENPLFSLSDVEEENVRHFLSSKHLVPVTQTNTLALIEHARVLICDFDSSIPFEALYFQNEKHLFVYETPEQQKKTDDRRAYFHRFHTVPQLTRLFERYFAGDLDCRTERSHEFFLEKYEEPDGHEIERLAGLRHWMTKLDHRNSQQPLDVEKIKQDVKDEFPCPLTQVSLYALGEHTTAQIIQLSYGELADLFNILLDEPN